MNNPEAFVYKHKDQTLSPARLNFACKLSLLHKIRNVLDEHGQLERWRRGPFSHLLDFTPHDQILCAKLILSLLVKELIYPGARADEMWFEIGGRAVRFGKQEFALVTGLRFGVIPQTKMHLKSTLNRYFSGERPNGKSLLLKVLSNDKKGFSAGNDLLKLCYVYVIFMMMGKDQLDLVPEFLWSIVEDISVFESYPWGTYLYSMTLSGLHRVINLIQKKRTTRYGIKLYGFPFAVQWWALEAFPCLGGILASKTLSHKPRTPRCLNWLCCKRPPQVHEKLYAEVNGLRTLEPTSDEISKEYYMSLDPNQLVDSELFRLGEDAETIRGDRSVGNEERDENADADAESSVHGEKRSKRIHHSPQACTTDPTHPMIQMILKRVAKIEQQVAGNFTATNKLLINLDIRVVKLGKKVAKLEEKVAKIENGS